MRRKSGKIRELRSILGVSADIRGFIMKKRRYQNSVS